MNHKTIHVLRAASTSLVVAACSAAPTEVVRPETSAQDTTTQVQGEFISIAEVRQAPPAKTEEQPSGLLERSSGIIIVQQASPIAPPPPTKLKSEELEKLQTAAEAARKSLQSARATYIAAERASEATWGRVVIANGRCDELWQAEKWDEAWGDGVFRSLRTPDGTRKGAAPCVARLDGNGRPNGAVANPNAPVRKTHAKATDRLAEARSALERIYDAIESYDRARAVPDAPRCAKGMQFIPALNTRSLVGFCLDRTEVTTRAYLACVKSGLCTRAESEAPGCNNGESGDGNLSAKCVKWSQANAYCHSQGQWLPTQNQWEHAASGPHCKTSQELSVTPTDEYGAAEAPCPVGTEPGGDLPFGLSDITGGLREWVWNNDGGFYHLVRGGGNDHEVSEHSDSSLGFRCASSPLP